MHAAIYLMIGLFVGGAVGVVAMCLVQVTRCAGCPHRIRDVNRDGK